MNDRTGRADYDQMVRIKSVPAEEPTFHLRAKDAVGAETVRDWAARAWRRGTPAATVEQALQQADRFDAWPTKEVADADHLTEAEALRLEHQFDRRAWKAREHELPSEAILLAERRGYNEAVAPVRRANAQEAARQRELLDAAQALLEPLDEGPRAAGQAQQQEARTARLRAAVEAIHEAQKNTSPQ